MRLKLSGQKSARSIIPRSPYPIMTNIKADIPAPLEHLTAPPLLKQSKGKEHMRLKLSGQKSARSIIPRSSYPIMTNSKADIQAPLEHLTALPLLKKRNRKEQMRLKLSGRKSALSIIPRSSYPIMTNSKADIPANLEHLTSTSLAQGKQRKGAHAPKIVWTKKCTFNHTKITLSHHDQHQS